MNQHATKQREIERYIAARIKRLDDTALVRLLAELRKLTTDNRAEARHV